MNISALSLSFVNLSAKSAPPATAGLLLAPVSKESDSTEQCGVERSSGRSNRQLFLHTKAQTLSHNGLDGASAPQRGAFIDIKA